MISKAPLPDVALYLENGAGDCELKSIAFDFPDLDLRFRDPYYARTFYIRLLGVNFIYFASNHVQNVVGRIYCFPSWTEAMSVDVFSQFANKNIVGLEYFRIKEYQPVLYVEPVTGGDLICQYATMLVLNEGEYSREGRS
jgi:hypothetical protein